MLIATAGSSLPARSAARTSSFGWSEAATPSRTAAIRRTTSAPSRRPRTIVAACGQDILKRLGNGAKSNAIWLDSLCEMRSSRPVSAQATASCRQISRRRQWMRSQRSQSVRGSCANLCAQAHRISIRHVVARTLDAQLRLVVRNPLLQDWRLLRERSAIEFAGVCGHSAFGTVRL